MHIGLFNKANVTQNENTVVTVSETFRLFSPKLSASIVTFRVNVTAFKRYGHP